MSEVGFMNLVQFMQCAKLNINHPKVRLGAKGGIDLQITIAGAQSKNAGWLYLKGGSDFSAPYYGKINPQTGKITWAATTCEKQHIWNLLCKLDSNPAETAALYGKETGQCCFCGLPLTDPRSVAVGYGPICADNFSLPWGDVTTADYKVAEEIVGQLSEELNKADPKEGATANWQPDFGKDLPAELLLKELQKPATLEDAILQIAELREMCWNLQRQINRICGEGR